MDNYSLDREEAIDNINSKTYDTTKTSPSYIFKMKTQENVDNSDESVASSQSRYYIGKSYKFDETTGYYSLSNYGSYALSDDMIGRYTCGSLDICSTMYKINEINGNTITNLDVYSVIQNSSFDSETGIYATTDADGPTYFYRGNVTNNNVQFGGFYWKVVRINGDGSIRLIYAGTSATESGEDDQIGTSAYNSKYWNPAYVGYKNTNTDWVLEESAKTAKVNPNMSSKYYFADSYIDNGDRRFKLSGNMIQRTWSEIHESEEWKQYPYTVFATSSSTLNYVVRKIVSTTDSYGTVNLISYVPKDYESTLRNETDSTIKTYIDSWYENNLLNATDTSGNNIVDYIYQDAKYCNDRSIYTGTYNSNGYSLTPITHFSSLYRLNKIMKPTLICSQIEDIFSVTNGNLDYPIALLTMDEAFLGGLMEYSINNDNYLKTGNVYFTMSPSAYHSTYLSARMYTIGVNGAISQTIGVNLSRGVRPVINLKSNVKITSGNGTTSNPYQLTID